MLSSYSDFDLNLLIIQIAMDLLKSLTGSSENEKPGSETSKSVPEAAQSTFNNASDKVDKAKASAAHAAADVLDAAQNYAKLDDKSGVGLYVDKAEDYLRKIEPSKSTTPAPAAEAEKPAPPAKKEEETGSGYGDVIKKAGGFFN